MIQIFRQLFLCALFLFAGALLASTTKVFSEEKPLIPLHPEIQRIIDKGELVVANVNKQAPPFFFKKESGELIGFDIELAQDLAKDLGVTLRFNRESNTYNAVIDDLALGKADIAVSNISLTLDRAKKILYSDPYSSLKQGVILNRIAYEGLKVPGKDDPTIIEKLNQPAAHIGVIPGSSFETWSKVLFPKATFIAIKGWDDEFVERLRTGEIMAAFRSDLAFRRLIALHPEIKPFVQPVFLKARLDTIHIAVPSGQANLLQWINTYIAKKRLHMTVDDLFEKYPELSTAKSS